MMMRVPIVCWPIDQTWLRAFGRRLYSACHFPKRAPAAGRTALEELSFEYMEEARVIERELSIPLAP